MSDKLYTLEEIREKVRSHSWNWQFGTESDHYQHQEGEDQFFSDLHNSPCILERFQHIRSPRRFRLKPQS